MRAWARTGLRTGLRGLALALGLGLAAGQGGAARAADVDLGLLDGARVGLPEGAARGTVYLFSGAAGWGTEETGLAARLTGSGAAVVEVDLPTYLAKIRAVTGDCAYLVSDIERSSHQIARQTGADTFAGPVVAGLGAGGALVLDMLAQTPDATIGAALAANPAADWGSPARLCTEAPRAAGPGAGHFELPSGALPAPLTVVLGGDAPADSAARVAALDSEGATYQRVETPGSAVASLGSEIDAALARLDESMTRLPLAALPTTPTHDAMAIVISGDGGWRDLDKTIAGELQSRGVPVVGLDALRYFWSRRTPEETAQDITRIVGRYSALWGTHRVVLIGYSFGAGVLPDVYAALPPRLRDRVVQVSLLGLAHEADWEITVSGWLGTTSEAATPVAAALAALPAEKVQCVYGVEEEDSPCPALEGSGAEVIRTDGGHHFDGDYTALALRVLDGLEHRQGTRASQAGGGSVLPVASPAGSVDPHTPGE
ncbi:virulence factor family protein (plasmid) [Paroceanicella profunda]|uniref:Virulence factor family protein n=1 Tax=Paroceanicella profunda TaxID=2579971 RepID=A0A5B8G5F9_9RHOB|nr:AcvB/VirJ family lysyl-phosphatidylglycerol hydrolase [Paroceanicella profunda]QDL94552.1 virulence factor family protein [Paroceanicella profunda]